jgi:galactokinase
MQHHFSAPGRTELGGNHTDHQHGCVLAAAVNLKMDADVVANDTGMVQVVSEGFPTVEIDLRELAPRPAERNQTAALVRGVAAGIRAYGGIIGGFDAALTSTVLPGSGLSSSAAVEVLLGRIFNGLYLNGRLTATQIAQIGQFAENEYFGKPCGLMDQMACSVGGLVYMNFADPARPQVERIDYDVSASGYELCIIDCGTGHADLTAEYAAIPSEMRHVASLLGGEVLGEVDEAAFFERLPAIRKKAGDRATLRALHFFEENHRVKQEAQALKAGDFSAFLRLVNESGLSSWTALQNVVPAEAKDNQPMAFALAMCRKLLGGQGACRVHGGGFAGTVQAFVPEGQLLGFKASIERVLGADCCHVLTVPPVCRE